MAVDANVTKDVQAWEPTPEHQITPTLVLTCGALSNLETATLKAQVLERVGLVLPHGFVHWIALEAKDETLFEKIESVLVPFLKLDYIEELQARGLVQNLLNEDREYDLHIVVVHKRGREDDPSQFLQDLGAKIRATMCGGVRFSLTLIAIGDGSLDLGEDNPFWPCFRLGSISYGRFAVSDKRILEVCQNLLVTLVTSELIQAIDWHLREGKQKVAWIWLGASALVVDVPSMQDYVRLQVLHQLIERMIGIEPSKVELQAREREVELCVDRLQGENLADALTQLQSDWSIRLQIKAHTTETYLTNQLLGEPELKSKGLHWRICKPDLNLAQALCNYYLQVRDGLVRFLGPRIRQRYEVLLGRIFALFDPPPEYAKQAEEWQLKYPPLFGLATVTHAIETATEYLRKSADIVHPHLTYHRIGSDTYLAAATSEDAHLAHRNYIRFRRKERTFLSWFGFLVKLIPAWPLLTGFLTVFPQWGVLKWLMIVLPSWPEEWCLAIAAFLLLTFIATIEYYAWQIDLGNWWEAIKRGTVSEIATTVLQITYKVLRDYRMLMVGRLQEISAILRELVNLLKKVDQEYRLLTAAIEDKIAWQEKRQSSIYWLTDLATCERWAKKAIKNIDDVQMSVDETDKKARPIFNIQARAILEGVLKYGPRFSYSRDPNQVLSHREIYSQIETIAQQAVNIASNEGRWEFYKEQGAEEREAAIARAPVEGLGVAVEPDQESHYIRICESQALRRMVESKPVYVLEKEDKYRLVTGREPCDFLRYNELDVCVLGEREELLKDGRRWQWLYQRAIPLGNGDKTQSFNFLTTADDSTWAVTAIGQYSEYWQKLKERGNEFKILRSVLPNEIGCTRIIAEFK